MIESVVLIETVMMSNIYIYIFIIVLINL